MRKRVTLISASALALGMGTALADQPQASNANTPQSALKNAPSFMFVVSAKNAQLKPGKDGNTLLVIKKSDLDRTIEFSDRPYRIVKYITGSDLEKDWNKGYNSFAADPPNAVLSAANMKPQIVVVNGINVSDSVVTLKLHGLQGNKTREVENLALTVDNHDCNFSNIIASSNLFECLGGVFALK